jgi:hypothetical protein
VTDEPKTDDDATASAGGHDEHSLKRDVRGAVAKVVGIAVEAGSMLAGQSGELVSAEGAVAENDTEQLIDRMDGEG